MKKENIHTSSLFEKFAIGVSKATGSTAAFILAFIVVIVWAISGPFFHYSENYHHISNGISDSEGPE